MTIVSRKILYTAKGSWIWWPALNLLMYTHHNRKFNKEIHLPNHFNNEEDVLHIAIKLLYQDVPPKLQRNRTLVTQWNEP